MGILDRLRAAPALPRAPAAPVAPAVLARALGVTPPPVEDSPDLRRILALPRRPRPSLAEQDAAAEEMTRRLEAHPRPCACRIHRLLPVQGWYLREASEAGGALGFVVAGGGKTGIGILLPMVLPDVRVAVLLLPPELRAQFVVDYEEWSRHFKVPNLAWSGSLTAASGSRRLGAIHEWGDRPFLRDRPVLHVLAYSELSHERCATWLTEYRPDLIVSDEAHRLSDQDSVRTSRFKRYAVSRAHAGSPIRFAGHSGSLTTRSILQYQHLAALALRDGSPVPHDPGAAQSWASCLDPALRGCPAPAGALAKLGGASAQDGFRLRLTETLGVITTEDARLPVRLTLTVRQPPPMPAAVAEAIGQTRASRTRPDGQEFTEEAETVACLRQLACGFFYRWIYPRGEPPDLIDRWFAARKAWFAELRGALDGYRRDRLDSPALLRQAAERWHDPAYRGDDPEWESEAWPAWRDVRDQVVPEVATTWIDDWLARDAVAWAAQSPGVIWYQHRAFGARVAELGGLPLYGEGDAASIGIAQEQGDRSIVASIKAHGTGKNLQRWTRALVTSAPSDAGAWEQLLARHHRTRQTRDVHVEVYQHTAEVQRALADATERARYVQATTGLSQRLLYSRE